MRHIRLAFYSAAHFWVDLSCALLLLGVVCPEADLVRCILLYNFSAFAVQMPIGLLADRLNRNHQVAAAGCGWWPRPGSSPKGQRRLYLREWGTPSFTWEADWIR